MKTRKAYKQKASKSVHHRRKCPKKHSFMYIVLLGLNEGQWGWSKEESVCCTRPRDEAGGQVSGKE